MGISQQRSQTPNLQTPNILCQTSNMSCQIPRTSEPNTLNLEKHLPENSIYLPTRGACSQQSGALGEHRGAPHCAQRGEMWGLRSVRPKFLLRPFAPGVRARAGQTSALCTQDIVIDHAVVLLGYGRQEDACPSGFLCSQGIWGSKGLFWPPPPRTPHVHACAPSSRGDYVKICFIFWI